MLEGLSAEQQAAVIAPTPLVIDAAAGSGKTRVITHRIAYQLMTRATRSTQSVAISFTRAAAWEVSRRLSRLLDGPAPSCGTFHSHALSLIQDGYAMLHRPPPRLIGDPQRLIAELQPKISEARRRAIGAELDRLRALGHDLHSLSEHPGQITIPDPAEFLSIVEGLERIKARQGLMDLTDALSIATELVSRHDGVGEALRLQARWVSIDEFQDVNPLQLRFIEAWMGQNLSGLTVVGDPNQSIYGWNGSDPELMGQLEARIPTITRLTLSTNYRSSEALVVAASPVVGTQSRVTVQAHRAGGQSPDLFGVTTTLAEAELAAQRIGELNYRGIPYASMAILARTIRQLAPIDESLRRLEIPHGLLGLTPLASAPEIINLMRIARQERLSITEICDMVEESLAQSPPGRTSNERVLLEVATELRRQSPDADVAVLEELLRGLQVSGIDAVSVTTFHRAKGLQWHHVHLIGIGDRSYPGRRRLSAQALAEEQRLLYVAMTRATDSLTISWSQPSQGPSSLLAHLPYETDRQRPTTIPALGPPGLATRLDRWRVRIGRERSVPAYQILSDADLRKLSRLRPTDDQTLIDTLTTPLLLASAPLRERLLAVMHRPEGRVPNQNSAINGA